MSKRPPEDQPTDAAPASTEAHADKKLKHNNGTPMAAAAAFAPAAAGAAAAAGAGADAKVAKSWLNVPANSDFPLQNLPYGVFRPKANPNAPGHIGVAIGTDVLDLHVLADAGVFGATKQLNGGAVFKTETLNAFMGLNKSAWSEARALLTALLAEGGAATLRDNAALRAKALIPQADVAMLMPAQIGDYTDFYSSRNHAYNVGVLIRGKENALQPNWLHLPVGYHGRSSSVVVSGTPIRRPNGQSSTDQKTPVFGPSKSFDFELECAFFVGGAGNAMGDPLSMASAADNIFGMVLMNDWSARDVQTWEYVPLGPFGAKNFGTTISPWVVTMEALAPFAVAAPVQDPKPLPYLTEPHPVVYDVALEVAIQGEDMKYPAVISRSNVKHLYWTFKQQLVHHSITGCNMRPGDLLGSGTISGPDTESLGCLLEMNERGKKDIILNPPAGVSAAEQAVQKRKFLVDGDSVLITGYCQGNGFRVGFGRCDGKLLPAHKL